MSDASVVCWQTLLSSLVVRDSEFSLVINQECTSFVSRMLSLIIYVSSFSWKIGGSDNLFSQKLVSVVCVLNIN